MYINGYSVYKMRETSYNYVSPTKTEKKNLFELLCKTASSKIPWQLVDLQQLHHFRAFLFLLPLFSSQAVVILK